MPTQKITREAHHRKVKPIYPRPTTLYRHLLRQAKRLPDPAARYFYQTQTRIQFRQSQGHRYSIVGSRTSPDVEKLLNNATWHLTRLAQANLGSISEMQQVVGTTYGFLGPVIAERAKYQMLLNYNPSHPRIYPLSLPISSNSVDSNNNNKKKTNIEEIDDPNQNHSSKNKSYNNNDSNDTLIHNINNISTQHLETLQIPQELPLSTYVPFKYGQYYIPKDHISPSNDAIIKSLSSEKIYNSIINNISKIKDEKNKDNNEQENDENLSSQWFPRPTVYPSEVPVHPRVLLSFEHNIEPFMYSLLYFLSTQSMTWRQAYRAWPDFAWIPLDQAVYDSILTSPMNDTKTQEKLQKLLQQNNVDKKNKAEM